MQGFCVPDKGPKDIDKRKNKVLDPSTGQSSQEWGAAGILGPFILHAADPGMTMYLIQACCRAWRRRLEWPHIPPSPQHWALLHLSLPGFLV